MAKPPKRTHSASGEELPSWGVAIEWNSETDTLVVRRWRADTLRRRGATKSTTVESGNVEDALAYAQVAARTLSARRLF